jgi:hypothetical protein
MVSSVACLSASARNEYVCVSIRMRDACEPVKTALDQLLQLVVDLMSLDVIVVDGDARLASLRKRCCD